MGYGDAVTEVAIAFILAGFLGSEMTGEISNR
jgi:FlaG/FlaF family flagellin (archaellin)